MMPHLHTAVAALRPWFLKIALIVGAAAPALLAGGCMFDGGPRATGSKTATAAHVPAAPVSVESRNGSVQIIADASRSDVQIDATITCGGDSQQEADQRLAQATLDVSRDTAHSLMVKPVFPGGPRSGDGASLVIHLPDASGITIKTSNGPVTVKALKGSLDVTTSNGPVTIADHDGPANIHSSNGAIVVSNLTGNLVAETSNGPITASGIKGSANVHTSNGAIDLGLDASAIGPIAVQSSNGPVKVKVGKAFRGKVTLNTSNGSLHISGEGVQQDRGGKTSAVIHVGEGGEPSTMTTSNGNMEFSVVK